MPTSVLRFTEAEKQAAAEAIFNMRHGSPGFIYNQHTDRWAYDYACVALAAIENGETS